MRNSMRIPFSTATSTNCTCQLWLWGMLLLASLNSAAAADDLGIVRVVAQPPNGAAAQFTATHLGNGWMLTCGHCCRYAGGPRAVVEVRVLRDSDQRPYRSEPGRVVCYDPAADVGLLRLDRPESLTTAYELAPPDFEAEVGLEVLMYGWTANEDRLRSKRTVVTTVNMFDGPANLETSDHPHPGDSGSPLVNLEDGRIIGVTTGADSLDRFGVHCGTVPIYRLLKFCGAKVQAVQQASAVDE